MRSRYTAFFFALEGYLLASWHPRTRPRKIDLALSPGRWRGLKVLKHEVITADTAIVEFIAHYTAGGRVCELHETSRFVREDGRWFYVDGKTSGL